MLDLKVNEIILHTKVVLNFTSTFKVCHTHRYSDKHKTIKNCVKLYL